ncbi:PrsW family intramembrane metalloprotease [Jatrophihabitans telluris]|uniref:PrsW family intramembrane metalloprotease n=1 Tax=Jatrophihabitans telluris TaxID=2038343 RepID=A0ABY4QYC0_9ACTN|nr:PrsW family intramembrane metalloprotease [Jatrophihabitans telluris]UQX88303.1 PrsW family intramembrane metalloprotease [Jatrophihabitans telluris]
MPWLRRKTRATGAPIAVLIGLGILAAAFALLAGVRDPAGLLIAVPSTTVAMLAVLAGYFWLDRWEPEPTRLLLLAFLWGATVAVMVSIALELATSEVLGKGITLTLVGPAIEEASKGAFLLVMLTGARRREFDGVVDGLVYAGFTAVGFAFIEDIGYIAQSFGSGTDAGVATIVLRLVLAPFAHPLFTSFTGIGIGLAVSRPRGVVTWAAPLVGFLAAIGLHALWNSSTTFGFGAYLLVYAVVMLPALAGAILWARHHRRRERDVVNAQLPAMVYYRWISPMEAGWLASIAARRAWVRAVRKRTGPEGARALKAFQNAATELAFLRDRVERGIGPADAYYLHADLVNSLTRNRAVAQTPLRQQAAGTPPLAAAPPPYSSPR